MSTTKRDKTVWLVHKPVWLWNRVWVTA